MDLKKIQAREGQRLRRVVDCVPRLDMFRADVEDGVFARRLVTATLNELFRFEYAERKFASGVLLPISTDVDEGANEYGYQELGYTGRAKLVADDATDLPYVEAEGRDTLHKIKTLACAFRYSTQEVRSSRLQGRFDIAAEKARSAREAYDTELNDLIRSGSAQHNLNGMTNAPGILVTAAANGAWQTQTAPNIVADFTAAANLLPNLSSGIEMPNTAAFDVASWTRISTLQNSAASDITVLQYLQRSYPMITTWEWEPGLSTANAAGTGPAVMIYRRDPTRMRAVIPMALRAMPPQQKGLTFEVALESRFGGVMAPKPRATLRLDNV